MQVKYTVTHAIHYNSLITEYVIEKTTSGWFSNKVDTLSVYKLSIHQYCRHKDGSHTSAEIDNAISAYNAAQEIERCLSI